MTRHRVAGLGVMSIRHFFDYRSELLKQQPKNGLALAFGPAQTLGVVVKDGASTAPVPAPAAKS